LLPGIGVRRYWLLVNALGSATAVLNSEPSTLTLLNAKAKSLLSNYQRHPTSSDLWDLAYNICQRVEKHHGHIITINDAQYPSLLKEIHQPPPVIYSRGNTAALNLPQIAIVGSRHATHAGIENTRMFSQHLADCGFTITSGLALGIDGAAHQAVLDHHHTTIAVMATGIDRVYPKSHQSLADRIIAEGGVLISEFPTGTPPKPDHFPRRNRIISGLSLGVLVVEAAIKSGSLITAKYALEQGREVFAIPSSIHNSQAKGCHQLIKQGATLVETSQDIVDHLQGLIAHLRMTISQPTANIPTQNKSSKPLNSDEQSILAHMGFEPITIDQLTVACQMTSQTVSASLMSLEVNGWIKLSAWGYERV
jgi:DNA processing protein